MNSFLRDQRLRDAVSRAVQDAADLGVSVAIDTLGNVGFGMDYTLVNTAAQENGQNAIPMTSRRRWQTQRSVA